MHVQSLGQEDPLEKEMAAVYSRMFDFHVKQGQGCLPFLCPWRVERLDKKTFVELQRILN